MSAQRFVWVPSEKIKHSSRLGDFLRRYGLINYAALQEQASTDPNWFWNALIEFFGIRFKVPYDVVVDLSAGNPWAKWCVGGKTNLVLNCLDAHMDTETQARTVVVWEGEDGAVRRWTYTELNDQTCALAGGLRRNNKELMTDTSPVSFTVNIIHSVRDLLHPYEISGLFANICCFRTRVI